MATGNRRLPAISSVRDEPITRPFKNGSGTTLAQGAVQCWKINTAGRTETETPSTTNQYALAGVVFGATAEGISVSDGNYGHLATGGRILALVDGTVAISAGDALTVSPSNTHLIKDTSPPPNPPFVAMEAYSTASVALKTVEVRL
jgi:hypothetical protein